MARVMDQEWRPLSLDPDAKFWPRIPCVFGGESALGLLKQFGTADSGVGGLRHRVAFGAKLAPMAAETLPLSAENRDFHAPCHDEMV